MWNVGISIVELAILAVVVVGLLCAGRTGRRWMAGIVPIFVLAVVITPADPVSTLVVALPLTAAFVAGVFSAGFLRRPHHGAPA
jgi:Sec-independent protein secretion pathway component TatC